MPMHLSVRYPVGPDYVSAFYLKGVGYKNLGNLVEADKAFAIYKKLRSTPQINIKYN